MAKENNLANPLRENVEGYIREIVVERLKSAKPQDEDGVDDEEIEYEDIGSDLYKQNLEKEAGTLLRRRLNDGKTQKYNVIMGDLFAFNLTTMKEYAVFQVGQLNVTIFEAVRSAK